MRFYTHLLDPFGLPVTILECGWATAIIATQTMTAKAEWTDK
jgi:hypothetical protein